MTKMMKVVSLLLFTYWIFTVSGNRHVEEFTKQETKTTGEKYLFPTFDSKAFSSDVNDTEQCLACWLLTSIVQQLVVEKQPEDVIVDISTYVCITAKIESKRICELITREYKDMVLEIVQKLVLTPSDVCGIILGPSCGTPYVPAVSWNITLPKKPKPPVTPPRPPAPGAPKVKFLQLTDTHVDYMYLPGSNPECGEPLCCRSNDGPPEPGVSGAGKWADLRSCDPSPALMDNLFQHLSTKNEEIDFAIFTGDISAHDVWNQTREDQIRKLELLVGYFEKYLPGTPVYFSAGNHDTAPCNSFPPPFITGHNSETWMYEAMAKNWGKWLPPETKETIMRGGFFTTSPYPGFRIISVNDNFCNSQNWWLMLNETDPAGHLEWLVDTLQKAEDNHEKVFILAHIPTDCMHSWSWNYYNIVSRYESTITGQFNGHAHYDLFKMYYDVANLTRPVSVAFNGGGLTPNSAKNPNYRIYTMDGFYKNSSFSVLDYDDYIFDLRKNYNSTVGSWEFEYNPLSDYGMKGLYPEDWSELIYRMKDDDQLFNKFYRHYTKGGSLTPCTGKCKTDMLCLLKRTRSNDPDLCKDL